MPPPTELQPTLAVSSRQYRQRLPLPVSPMGSETLNSYLRRVTERNLLRTGWLSQLSRQPHFVADLIELTGLTERGLVTALPELRNLQVLQRWPHLVGRASKQAGIRYACTHCVATRTRSRAQAVTVFASHEQVLCTVHQQWTGSSELKCAPHEQFSVRTCPDIADANRAHLGLIRRWGRGSAYSCFTAAVTCFSMWSGWPAVSRAPDIKQRRERLDIPHDAPPLTPRQVAAWYPSAVALTEIIVSLRHEGPKRGRSSAAKVVAKGLVQLHNVVPGLSPSGASDPFRQAILAELHTPPSEVEVAPDSEPCQTRHRRKDNHDAVRPKV